MLKKIRVILSLLLFTLITLYFLDFSELLPNRFRLLAEIQLIPALLAFNIIILGSLVLLTLLFGRVYCSSICPMGIYQDIVAWFSKKIRRKKKYNYSKAKTVLRWSVLAVTALAFLFGFTFLLGLLDPYGAFGRIVTHLFQPVYLAGNNLLETIFTSFDNYTFYKVSIYILSVSSLIIALVTLLAIGYLAWRNGRTWCNTICPVGTLLGFLSKFSLLKVRFVDEQCNMCGLCAMKCKASCIDSKNKRIDYSRCVACFNCIESCNRSAMKYSFNRKQVKTSTQAASKNNFSNGGDSMNILAHNDIQCENSNANFGISSSLSGKSADTLLDYKYLGKAKTIDESKRRFLSASLLTGLAAGNLLAKGFISSEMSPYTNLQDELNSGKPSPDELSLSKSSTNELNLSKSSTGELLPKRAFKRLTPIAPPGTPTFDHLREKCISCHLCVSKCPANVIKPAFLDYGLGGMMQPKLSYDHGFCNYDCVICGEVCPTGAILPLTKEEKNHTQMGQVQLIIENCIVYYDETSCGACSEHCPTQAVRMVPYKDHLTIPEIEPEICVGCGGCEYVCPAIPYKAIYVEGLQSQNIIEIEHDEVEEIEIDDFGF